MASMLCGSRLLGFCPSTSYSKGSASITAYRCAHPLPSVGIIASFSAVRMQLVQGPVPLFSQGCSQLSELPRCSVVVHSQAGGTSSGGPPRAGKKKVKKLVDINGDVLKDLGNGMFTIKLENGVSVMAHLSGKIRQNRIKIVTGDKVTVELSPYDLTRGRITYRFRPGELAAAAAAAATAAAAAAAAPPPAKPAQ